MEKDLETLKAQISELKDVEDGIRNYRQTLEAYARKMLHAVDDHPDKVKLEIEISEEKWAEVVATVISDAGGEPSEVKELVESDILNWVLETYANIHRG